MIWLLLLPILIGSIVVHELAHAWVARREGDDTAERQGRITLNPIPHLDPVGSFLVPAILIALPGSFIFGWARPVPVNPANFRDRVWGDIRVSLAGPASNVLLALAFTLLLVPAVSLAGGMEAAMNPEEGSLFVSAAFYGILINLILAVFNMIPVPPLDGSHVLRHLLPEGLRASYDSVGRIGILVLLGFLFLVPEGFGIIMAPVFFMTDILVSVVQLVARA
ncbi:MAG: site-2 protease family protein [Gemmatimonadales bacterium]|nr:MAG: site-2 protease family protein [Gemmatimonadales bacterium]